MSASARLKSLLVALTLVAAGSGTAQAVTMTRTFNLAASGFSGSPPLDPMMGSFTVTWDNSVNHVNETTGISGSIAGFALSSALGFTYDFNIDRMRIGGLENGVFAVSNNVGHGNDFLVTFTGASSTPAPTGVFYITSDSNVFFIASAFSVTVDMPEPASLALLAGAIGALGLARRRSD